MMFYWEFTLIISIFNTPDEDNVEVWFRNLNFRRDLSSPWDKLSSICQIMLLSFIYFSFSNYRMQAFRKSNHHIQLCSLHCTNVPGGCEGQRRGWLAPGNCRNIYVQTVCNVRVSQTFWGPDHKFRILALFMSIQINEVCIKQWGLTICCWVNPTWGKN